MPTIRTHFDEHGAPVIENPIMRGAVVDYKATAHALATQHTHKYTRLIARDFAHVDHLLTYHMIKEHWSSFLLPKAVKQRLNAIED